MAEQLTDKIIYPGGYVDDIMSVDTFEDLLALPRGQKFVGLTVTVKKGVTTQNGDFVPVDVWLSESRNGWVVKTIAPVDNLDCLNVIPKEYMYIGFKAILKNGEKYTLSEITEEQYSWEKELGRTEFDSIVVDIVNTAVNESIEKVTSGASAAFDTLKEVEDWIINDTTGAASMANNISALKAISADTRLLKLEDVSHSHSNKALLDTYTQTESDLADAVAKKHAHENKAVLDGITAVKVSAWDAAEANAISSAKTYTDSAITVASEDLNWILVEGEKQKVRNWRGTRANYEMLVQNSAVSPWTRYVVIDTINGKEVITEYYGQNQVAEATGQLLPVKDIIGSISEITPQPYDRYLVGSDGQGYQIYEYVIEGDFHKWLIKPFDYRYGVRVIERGLKNYVYVNNVLKTYDDVDCGSF